MKMIRNSGPIVINGSTRHVNLVSDIVPSKCDTCGFHFCNHGRENQRTLVMAEKCTVCGNHYCRHLFPKDPKTKTPELLQILDLVERNKNPLRSGKIEDEEGKDMRTFVKPNCSFPNSNSSTGLPIPIKSGATSTALARTDNTPYFPRPINPYPKQPTSTYYGPVPRMSSSASTTSNEIPKISGSRVKALEKFEFRKLDAVSIASSVSNTKRYSDVTLVYWLKRKTSSYSTTTYRGGTQYTSHSYGDFERVVVHLTYDIEMDFWTITTSLLKRTSWSAKDDEEKIAERLCSQEDLRKEVKRALLFFSISPREAYKLLRKTCKGEFVHEYDEDGVACITQSKNSFELYESLKKHKSSSWEDDSGTGSCGHRGYYGWD